MRADAIRAGDEETAAAMDRLMALLDADHTRSEMPTTRDTTKALRDGLRAIKDERDNIAVRLATGEISQGQADIQRGALRRQARDLDAASRAQFAELAIERESEARSLRAKAEADRDPAARMADEMERARIVAGPLNAMDIVAQADYMLAAGQPARAKFLLEAATDKGARVDPSLVARIEDALDASDPLRKDARAIEDDLAVASNTFNVARLSSLAEAGFGVNAAGDIGEGSSSEVATASVHSKVLAYAAGERSFPVGDGSNAEPAS